MALLLNANDSVNRSYTITKPSPNHPLDVNGVGVRTENLWGDTTETNKYIDGQGNIVTPQNGDIFDQKGITITPSSNFTFSWSDFVVGTDNNVPYIRICSYTTEGGTFINRTLVAPNVYPDKYATFTIPSNCTYIDIRIDNETSTRGQHFVNLMLNVGSTAKPFEPWGYKIPISSPVVTTNIYLGSTQTVRQVKKIVFDGTENWSNQNVGQHGAVSIRKDELPLAPDMPAGTLNILSTHFKAISNSSQLDIGEMVAGGSYLNFDYDGTNNLTDFKAFLATQYANGTPVIVYYVLATPKTGIVNEPLMKIGEYADTVSNAASIPTTEGANSITVDTTVQPSEFTATWTGWHNANVKEWNDSQWNE